MSTVKYPIPAPAETLAPGPKTESGDASSAQGGGDFDYRLPSPRDATIMMVDDEETTIDVVQMFLEDAGYTNFITTTDSTRALDIITESRPDVVLLDLKMPVVSGFDILAHMRADSSLKHIPVIILTSATDGQTKLKALELGATDFLGKPVDSSELVLRLRNTLTAKAYQDRLAFYDGLTGLPNRRMFMSRLERALQRARHENKNCVVMHINLDRFKQINDTLGHSAGDLLLKLVARRLEACLRPDDLVMATEPQDHDDNLFRIGGDEFTIFIPDIGKADNATQLARRVLGDLAKPCYVAKQELFLTSSIGIAVYPDDGDDLDTLLKHADIAMSHAKQQGKNTYQFYSKEINARTERRLSLEHQLRKALSRDEISLHYQPKVDIASGRVIGAEALMRWTHRDLGMVSPMEFIPIAEEAGLITELGAWALHTASAHCKGWQNAGLGELRIAVNVSSQQFRQQGLLQTIQSALGQAKLDPKHLVIELTESMIMANPAESVAALREIKEMGLKLSVDDFGTGYSSLSYLKRFPLDELKVDRSFVKDIPGDADDAAITAAIIVLAHSLGLSVVAEGVETAEQLAFLKNVGCDEFQGYFFSKPLPEPAFVDRVKLAQEK